MLLILNVLAAVGEQFLWNMPDEKKILRVGKVRTMRIHERKFFIHNNHI